MFGIKFDLARYEPHVALLEARPVEKGKILLYGDSFFGHSSFLLRVKYPDRIKPLVEDVVRTKDGEQAVLNHGFGGSCTDELLYYYHRLVKPYEPRALVLHIGSNDTVYGYSPAEIAERVGVLVDWFRKDFPEAPVYIMNRTPNPKFLGQVDLSTRLRDEYNALLELLCAAKGCKLIRMNEMPIYFNDPADIGDYNLIRTDIYNEDDQAHMNVKGYEMLMDYYKEFFEKEGLL